MLLQFINIGRPQDIFTSVRYVYPGIVAFVFLLLTAFFSMHRLNTHSLFASKTVRRFSFLVVLMIAITPICVAPGKAFFFLTHELIYIVVFYFCFCIFIKTERELSLSVAVMTISSLMLSIAIVIKGGSAAESRISTGSMYDPNDIALLFVSILPMALFCYKSQKKWLKYTSAATVLLSVVAIGLTQSRGAFLGLAVLFIVWIFQRTSYQKIKNSSKKILLVMLIVLVSAVSFPQSYWQRMGEALEEGATGSGRTTVWPRALKMMVWHPQGVGPGCFTTVYGLYLSSGKFQATYDVARNRAWMTAHNSYILVGAELGFLGIIIYMAWLVGMYNVMKQKKKIIKDLHLNDRLFGFCSMAQLSLIGFMIPAFFLSQSFSYILLTISGQIVAIEHLVDNEAKRALSDQNREAL